MTKAPAPTPKPADAPHRPVVELRPGGTDGKTIRNATVVIAVVVAGASLYWLRGIFTPLALAIFLMVMIDGFAGQLERRIPKLPQWGALALAITAAVVAFGLVVVLIAEYAASFASQLTAYGPRLNDLIVRVAAMVGVQAPPSLNQLFDQLNPTKYIGTLVQSLQSLGGNALFVLVYLGFLIASRAGFAKKVVRLFPHREERGNALDVFNRIRLGVEHYLWIQTVLGALIAVLSWGVMAAVGLDNAFFWAFLIFVAGYIPIIGGLIGCVLPPVIALVQFDTFWPALILFTALNVINFIAANVLQPRMQGASLNLDPVVILLALAFWGVIWGVAGMFLSTPLTVMTMVILAQFPATHWIAILLSGDGDPLGVEKRRRKGPIED